MTDCIERDASGNFYEPPKAGGFAPWGSEAPLEDPEWPAFEAEITGAIRVREDVDEDGASGGFAELERDEAERFVKRYRNLARDEAQALAFIEQELAEKRAEMDALMVRREELQKPFKRRREYLDMLVKPLLERFARRAIGDGKTRSLKLAYGTLKLRRKPAALVVEDELVAVAWARENAPYALKTSIHKVELNSVFKIGGEVPDGCEVRPAEDVFSLEVED